MSTFTENNTKNTKENNEIIKTSSSSSFTEHDESQKILKFNISKKRTVLTIPHEVKTVQKIGDVKYYVNTMNFLSLQQLFLISLLTHFCEICIKHPKKCVKKHFISLRLNILFFNMK